MEHEKEEADRKKKSSGAKKVNNNSLEMVDGRITSTGVVMIKKTSCMITRIPEQLN